MVIIGIKFGQLANRLLLFGHFLANAVEYGYRIVNPGFDDYKTYFKATSTGDFLDLDVSLNNNLLPVNSVYLPLLRAGCRMLPRSSFHAVIRHYNNTVFYDLNDTDFVEKALSSVVIVDGWYFRDYVHFRKHAQVLRKIFVPLENHQEKVQILLEKCRGLGDVVVGVHIRRGDYKTWRGGKYYFTDQAYRNAMQQLESYFSARGKTATFLICSDESVESERFSPLTVIPAGGHQVEDLYSLAGCDYIIGPPSTFSMWASFYGEVPLYHLSFEEEKLDIEKFVVSYG
jgi:Glycosyl transferase family 11